MPKISFVFDATGQADIVKGFKSIEQAASKSSSLVARADAKAASSREASARKRMAAENKELAALERRLNKEIALEGKAAKKKSDAITKARASSAARAWKQIQAEKRRAPGIGSQALDIGGTFAKGIAGTVFAGGALAAGVVGKAASEASSLEEKATRLSINSRQAGGEFVDAKALAKEFQQAAIKTPGITGNAVAAGADKFAAATGDLDAFRRNLDTLTTVTSATGANFEDVADTAAALQNQFKITGVEDVQKALTTLTLAGKAGAFEIVDAARLMGRVAASASGFGLEGLGGLQETSGLLQIARSATGSGEQAATATENVFSSLNVKEEKFKAAGVKFKDKEGNKLGVGNVLAQSIAKMKKGDLMKLFGEQGSRALLPLIADSETAKKEAGGGKKGEEAAFKVVAERLRAAGDASTVFAEIQKDAARAQQTTSSQLTAAWQGVIAEAQTNLLPELQKMAPALLSIAKDAIPPMVKMFGIAVRELVPFAQGVAQAAKVLGYFKGDGPGDNEYAKEASVLRGMQDEVSRQISEASDDGNYEAIPELKKDYEALGERIRWAQKAAAGEETIKAGVDQQINDKAANHYSDAVRKILPTSDFDPYGAAVAASEGFGVSRAREESKSVALEDYRQNVGMNEDVAGQAAMMVYDKKFADAAAKADRLGAALDGLSSKAEQHKGLVNR